MSRRMRTEPEGIGTVWSLIGGFLFLIALAAPLAIVHMGAPPVINNGTLAQATITKTAATEVRSAEATAISASSDPSLQALLTDGAVVPGVRAGKLYIGADADSIIAEISEPSSLRFDVRDGEVVRRHEIPVDTLDVTILSSVDDGKISALHIATSDCPALQRLQGAEEALPSMSSGISIGSHVSRVIKRLGPAKDSPLPDVGTTEARALRHVYPGLTIDYCTDSMVIGALSISPVSDDSGEVLVSRIVPALDVPDIRAEPLRVAEAPTSEPTNTARAYLDRTFEDPTTQPQDAPSAPLETLTSDASPIERADAPDVLLTLNGNAYERFDTFDTDAPQPAAIPVKVSDLPAASRILDAPILASLPLENAEAVESSLTAAKRRELQVRLSLLGYGPRGADGIFGPKTRTAIGKFQTSQEIASTGYLDTQTQKLLETRSRTSYANWKQALANRRKKAREVSRPDPVLATRVPPARNAPECARDRNGVIIANQSWSCDVTTFEESIGLPGLFDSNS